MEWIWVHVALQLSILCISKLTLLLTVDWGCHSEDCGKSTSQ